MIATSSRVKTLFASLLASTLNSRKIATVAALSIRMTGPASLSFSLATARQVSHPQAMKPSPWPTGIGASAGQPAEPVEAGATQHFAPG